MKPRHRELLHPWIVVTHVLILILLGGCAEVEVVDTTPDAGSAKPFVSPLAVDPIRHDLVILGLDFDPPLEYQQLILREQSLVLLIAIENAGTVTEQEVVAEARLTTPEDEDLLLSQQAIVSNIAPGEIQTVNFEPLTKIPYHTVFHLEVSIGPVEGERDTTDNHKAFEIQIHRN